MDNTELKADKLRPKAGTFPTKCMFRMFNTKLNVTERRIFTKSTNHAELIALVRHGLYAFKLKQKFCDE